MTDLGKVLSALSVLSPWRVDHPHIGGGYTNSSRSAPERNKDKKRRRTASRNARKSRRKNRR